MANVETHAAWKQAYIQALIKQLRPTGKVLEVGFGDGEAAHAIQAFHPQSHTVIVEAAGEAKKWVGKQQNATVIEGSWKEKLKTLGQFDAIFFHDIPFDLELFECHTPDEASLTKAKEVVSHLQAQISKMQIRYTDKDIEEFYESTGKHNLKELPTFFENLKKNGFITPEQYDKACRKYCANTAAADPLVAFIEQCLEKHTHKGSRISCLITDCKSKYEDPLFFDRIITNPNLHYEEDIVAIDIPECPLNNAIAMVIERLF